MPLDVEIPVLRGFLTPSEASAWKQSIFGSAGETPDSLFIISPFSHRYRHEEVMLSDERFRNGHTGKRLSLVRETDNYTQWCCTLYGLSLIPLINQITILCIFY